MKRIEDYALIGDCETAALVHRHGSIDWLCWPRFDSEACFAALLGTEEHGRWSIAPTDDRTTVSRHYRGDTLILETRFETETGAVALVDFMPLRGGASDLVRIVVGLRGEVPMHMHLALRFGYGQRRPWLTRFGRSGLRALSGPHSVLLQAPMHCQIADGDANAEFLVRADERVPFVLTYSPSHEPPAPGTDPERAIAETEAFWNDWASRCTYVGQHRDAVVRSLVTMKALTYQPTGGMVAAPTTSLPERHQGTRNWDYRYCWLRDATFVLLTLISAGYRREAEAWTDWLLRAVAGDPRKVQPIYGVAGEHRLGERTCGGLPGFNGARPVRIGNAAFAQRQIDIFGEVIDVMHQVRVAELEVDEADWAYQKALVSHLESIWDQPDEGIWEVRGPQRHFVHSKVMSWVAFDRAVKAAERFGLDGPSDRWKRLRAQIHEEVCRRGFDEGRGAFTQAYGSDQLDAANLLIPLVGFLPADDRRIIGTLAAIERDLTDRGLVLRYRTHETDDGLPPGEGTFLACSFWFVDNLVLQGRLGEAEAKFEHLLSLRNDVGLLAEEYDPGNRRQMGNFPQAISHMSLVDTAMNLAQARGPAKKRAEEQPQRM
ncbi:glucoamylase [Allostella sp. ATCC 35155]|nr:glucoamylase [Stella sp. ATCC 35155]